MLKAQLVVLRLAAAELELVFAERRAADYPRFAEAALQSLGTEDAPTDTALALDATLRHVLVDEFQDTSETQVRLLEKLTMGWQRDDGRTLFAVGDPMQSIYRFRGADVGLFLDVRNRGLGDLRLEPLTLAVNFRSTRPVIDWINTHFARVLPATDDEATGSVSYTPSTGADAAGEEGGVQVHALLRRSRLHEAACIADIVERTLAEDDSASVAILVQGRSHLVGIVAEFARRGVPFQATDIDPLGERPVVLDLLALTRAIAHPADRPAWLAVLRAPWCGLTLAQLHALCGDERDATLPELLRDSARRERLEPDAHARLDRAWQVLREAPGELRRFGLRDTVERAWLALGGPATASTERELDEAAAYLDELAEIDRRASGLVDLAKLAEALEELYAPSRPDKSIRVELLTIHKAKGLQFDTVIVPGLERRSRPDDKRLLQWVRQPGAPPPGLVVAPVAGTGAEPNRPVPMAREPRGRKASAGKTPAALRRCDPGRSAGCTCSERASSRTRTRGSDTGTPAVVRCAGHAVARRRAMNLPHASRSRATSKARHHLTSSASRRCAVCHSHGGFRSRNRRASSSTRSPTAAAQQPVEFDWATETARHVGTVVHRELQRIARDGAAGGVSVAVTRRRYVDELAELGVPAERRQAAVERVASAVSRTLEDERGRWLLDARHSSSANELALTGRIDGTIVSVVIDRTFVDETGVRWIVDYKSSSHEGADLDGFLASEQERYRPQLERYASLMRHVGPEPIRLGLYFPLLSAWRSWLPAGR